MRKVMFPVGGLGTRFLPATKTTPKEMLPIVDKPLIQYGVEEAVEAGADSLVFITSRMKHSISDHFNTAYELETKLRQSKKDSLLRKAQATLPADVNCAYVPQAEALGLGHAVLCGADAIGDEAFGIILADDLIKGAGSGCMAQMVKVHLETGYSVLAVEEVAIEDTGKYGIVSTTAFGESIEKVEAIVEKPAPDLAPSNLAVVGRYILTPKIFELLRTTPPGAGGEIQLTDAIAALIEHETVLCFRFKGQRYDCGSKFGFIQATIEYGLDHPDLGPRCREYLRQKKF